LVESWGASGPKTEAPLSGPVAAGDAAFGEVAALAAEGPKGLARPRRQGRRPPAARMLSRSSRVWMWAGLGAGLAF
jgi:hypothetical protein